MLTDFEVGDLVIPKDRQTLFGWGPPWGDPDAKEQMIEKMGLGVVVDINPLFINGRFKVWWSKAQMFTREESLSLSKIGS